MTSNETEALENQFVDLLEKGEAALAAGSPWYPEKDQGVPQDMVPRLRSARKCLALLESLWPKTSTQNATATDHGTGTEAATDFDPADGVTRIGRYEVQGELGRGGMGVVYRAWQPDLKRPVALKMILSGMHAGAQAQARFRREAQLAASLRHPHIVQVHDTGEHGNCPYFSLELMDGGTLAKRLAGQPQLPEEAAEVVEVLARAVQYAHEAGIVHRDLKPSNILLQRRTGVRRSSEKGPAAGDEALTGRLCADYFCKVGDFGLARELDDEATRTGQVIGTPSYMAPEQARGEAQSIGPATDVYGLGAILYELLTGRPPFKGKSHHETLEQVKHKDVVAPRRVRPDVPRDLEKICLKCLEKEPQRRYRSARELVDDLGRYQSGEPVKARPRTWLERMGRWVRRRTGHVVFVGVLVTLLGAAVFAATTWDWERHPKPDNAPLRSMLAEVQDGKTVELVGPVGLPHWYRWRAGRVQLDGPQAGKAPLEVASWGTSVLELLPEVPRQKFRIRGEIQPHKLEEVTGYAGLYIGYHEYPGPSGPEHSFLGLAFEFEPEKPPKVVLMCHHFCETNENAVGCYGTGGGFSQLKLTAADINKSGWHDFAVEVRMQSVLGFWRGAQLPETELFRLNHLATTLGDIDPAKRLAEIPLRGGVGLFVTKNAAEFRNIVIEPLD